MSAVVSFSYSNFISISNSLCCDDDDDEEAVKSAIEAAETSAREEMRSQFRDSIDLLHRLFICISGQLICLMHVECL